MEDDGRADGTEVETTDGAAVDARGGGARRRRRTLVALVLGVVALAVVGMHQLSLGHSFVTPTEGVSYAAHAHGAAGPGHGDLHPADLSHTAGHAAMGTAADMGATDRPAAPDDGCAGCSDHAMGLGTCLLALTLLVIAWWLRLPPPRALPPEHRRPVRVRPLAAAASHVRALSLAELSILRT